MKQIRCLCLFYVGDAMAKKLARKGKDESKKTVEPFYFAHV